MQILVPNETRFIRAGDGTVWVHSTATYDHWSDYLEVFDQVNVLARVQPLQDAPANYIRADGPGVGFVDLPYYHGPAEYLTKRRALLEIVRRAVDAAQAITLRAPGQISSSAKSMMPSSRPYGVEVLGDPFDVFSPGAVTHPLRPLFRYWFTRQLKTVVQEATAVGYVTEQYLQQRYPSAGYAFTTHFSALGLGHSYYSAEPRSTVPGSTPIHVVTVASLEQMYKGTDVLIRAIGQCRARGMDLFLTIVGDGRYRADLERLTRELGLDGRVHFMGQLPSGDPVREVLDRAHIFVLPSLTEGLPRAVIEAMARGLPAIGTAVGGIPELLAAEDLIPPGDAMALADKLYEVSADADRFRRMSRRNLQRAQDYSLGIIKARRKTYYEALRDQTCRWLQKRDFG